MDNPIPTKIAVIAFGSLKFMIMYSQVSLLADEPKRLLTTSLKGMATCPKLMFNSKAKSKSKVSDIKSIEFRFCVFNLL